MDAERVEELLSELEELVGSEDPTPYRPERPADSSSGATGAAPRREEPPAEPPAPDTRIEENEEELRRGLEVLDEIIELRPDHLALQARKLRYLHRLGETTRRSRAAVALAERMAERGDRRAAALLCRFLVDRRANGGPTEDLLSSLQGLEDREPLERRAPPAAGWRDAPAATARERLRRAVEEELAVHAEALPLLYRARRRSEAGDAGSRPLDGCRDYARYLLISGRTDEACEVLTSVLEGMVPGADEEAESNLRADLVECLLESGRRAEAREHLNVLARRDEAFAVVASAI